LQLYYDRTHLTTPIFTEGRDTYDVDVQHRFQAGTRNDVVWGLGYRLYADNVDTNLAIKLFPPKRRTQIFSTFVQDAITLVPEKLILTLGSKFEHNDYTGFEIQPNVRLTYMPTERQTLWGAISRAVRTPSRVESDISFQQPIGPGQFATIVGNPNFKSEKLIAYELGHRIQYKNLYFDTAAFYNRYDDLRTIEPSASGLVAGNGLKGESYGIELGPTYKVADWWRLQAAYTWLQLQLSRKPGSLDPFMFEKDIEGRSPHHQFTLRSSFDLPQHLQLDGILRYVDSLPGIGVARYYVLDLRLGWNPYKDLEFSIVGQNLLSRRHAEFTPSALVQTQPTQVESGVYGKVTWHF
jgi:iron complex outermembrane receptor protein